MRALVQRVSKASVSVKGKVLGRIGRGLVIFLGISTLDTHDDAVYISGKIINLRIFADGAGKFNRSSLDTGAELLAVSQFTLYGDTRKGRRPNFLKSAPQQQAETLFNQTLELLVESGLKIQTGCFRTHMMVSIENDGPVTIMIDSEDKGHPRQLIT